MARICIVCGRPVEPTKELALCALTGGERCDSSECYDRAVEFDQKMRILMIEFYHEKYRLLRPIVDKLNAELFLLRKDYLKGN